MNSTATFQGRSKKSLGLEGNTVLSDSSISPESSESSESTEETRWVLLDFRKQPLVKIRVLFQLTLSIFQCKQYTVDHRPFILHNHPFVVALSCVLHCCTRLSVGMMLRWSTQRANDRYKDHLDGQLTMLWRTNNWFDEKFTTSLKGLSPIK